jgi:hypothetical protein
VEFRDRYDGAGMLDRFREDLVLPHAPALRRLSPLTHSRNPNPVRVMDS